MNNSIQKIKLKVLETTVIQIESRGSSGLQLLFRVSNNNLIEIKRINDNSGFSNSNIGGPLMVKFEIKAVKTGNSKIVFYETQPWNKNFKELIKKEVDIEITT